MNVSVGRYGDLHQWHHFLILLILAIVIASSSVAQDLFISKGVASDLRPYHDDTVVRARTVSIDKSVLPTPKSAPGAPLTLNLFDDVTLPCFLDQSIERDKSSYTWVCGITDDPHGKAIITVNGDIIVANIRTLNKGYFQIRVAPDGSQEVREIDESAFAPCGTDASDAVAAPKHDHNSNANPGMNKTDEPTIFDVLIVYTPQARMDAGGTEAIKALIYLGVDEGQIVYSDSLIDVSLRVVHFAETNYTEAGTTLDLPRLAFSTDGHMDEVHTLRNTYQADIVSLWGTYTGTCGRGYVMTTRSNSFESSAFNVNDWSCAVGNYTWLHEMGHNMGCQHDRDNTSGSIIDPYAYGWRWFGLSTNEYRSVMSYAPGTRIGNFSNPNVLFDGVATGVPVGNVNESYNALTITNSAPYVANWRMRSDDLLIEPAGGFSASGDEGGPFTPGCKNYTLTNRGVASFNWSTTPQPWITVTPGSGTLAGGASIGVTVCTNVQADALPKGIYDENVIFTNDTAGYFQLRETDLRVTGCTDLPFYDDFESGVLGAGWKLTGTNSFRMQATESFMPYAGAYHMVMDSALDGVNSRNEATLCLNLNGFTNLSLNFWAKDLFDEDHAPPANPIVGGADFDGVAISVDNTNWYEVQALRGGTNDLYTAYSVDLDAAISGFSLTLGSALYVRFNQYDNFGADTDGIAIDNVLVSGTPPNDDCASPLPLVLDTPILGSTSGAAGTDITPCAANDTLDVWYQFIPPVAGEYFFSTCGSSFDTTLALFDACGGSVLACNDDATCTTNLWHAEICHTLPDTSPILVRVSGYEGTSGLFTLLVTNDCSATGGEPSIFSQGSTSVWREIGESAVFSAPDLGTGKPNSFEWTYKPAGGGPTVVIPGEFIESLTLSNLSIPKSGDYTVRFYNGTGTVIYTWRLSVVAQLPLVGGWGLLIVVGLLAAVMLLKQSYNKRRHQ